MLLEIQLQMEDLEHDILYMLIRELLSQLAATDEST